MPNCLIRVAALSVCVATSLAAQAGGSAKTTAAAAGPRIVISSTEVNLGLLPPEDTGRSFDVSIRNTGNAPLVIRKIRTSCPCLKADLAPGAIASGAETTMRMHFKRLALDEAAEEAVLIYSNDPQHPASKFRVVATIGSGIRILPQQALAVGPVYRSALSQAITPTVELVSADGVSLGRIKKITPSHPAIHPEIKKLEDHRYELTVTLDETIPLGNLNGSVKVETEHPTAPVVNVPVLAIVFGDLTADGRRMDFGFIPEGTPASITFRMHNVGKKEIKVLRAEPKLPVPAKLEVTPDPQAPKTYKLVLSVGPMPGFTQLGGTVELHTDDPTDPLVRVEVSGGVLSKKPFEQAAADGTNERFLAIVTSVLERGDRIPVDRFYSDVLGGVKDERAIAVLLRALEVGNVPARMQAVELLKAYKTPEVVERLRQVMTDDSHAFVRRPAMVAYWQATGKAAVPMLLMGLVDDDDWLREDAATMLGKTGDRSVIPLLEAALADPNPETAAAVRDALTALQAVKR